MTAQKYRIRGRVQAVGFRYFTDREAGSLGVKGWVRNLSNGDVEVHAEGSSDSVKAFRARLESGPPLARVSEINIEPAEVQGFEDFSMLYC